MRILGISSVYHTRKRPERGSFIRALFETWRNQGNQVSVVSPVSVMRLLYDELTRWGKIPPQPEEPDLIRPWFATVSDRLVPWNDLGGRLSNRLYMNAVKRGIDSVKEQIDFAYAHFFDSGLAALPTCKSRGIQLLLGLGESSIDVIERIVRPAVFAQTISDVSGVVTVSKDLEDFVRDRVPEIGTRLTYIPNGINEAIFKKQKQDVCRSKLNIPQSDRVLAFTGHFIPRKGAERVMAALSKVSGVKGLFMGQGKNMPSGHAVLHAGPVLPEEMPTYLNAADFFVLPSRLEGMCNAILEAMACGLPLIVSDRSFNRSFLNEDCALFVDPDSPTEIANAIRLLAGDQERRAAMSRASIELAKQFTLKRRAERILEFRETLR